MMNELDIGWRSALLLSLFIPQLLLVIKLLSKPVERKASMALGLFLLIYSFTNVPHMIGFMGAYDVWPQLTFAPFILELLLGPILLMHIHFLTSKQPLGKIKYLLIPGILQLVYYSTVFVIFDDYRDKWSFSESFHVPYIYPLEIILITIVTIYCGVMIRTKIKHYQEFLHKTQSDIDNFDPKWLDRFLIMFFSIVIMWFIYIVIDNYWYPLNYRGEFPFHMILSVLVLWKVHEGLCHLFENYPKPEIEVPVIDVKSQSHDWDDLMSQINTAVYEDQLYLQSKLTITQLARKLGNNETYISRALNLSAGMNFNKFINQARIDAAKKMLCKASRESILEIALSVGFSSKSTFNRLFKEYEGITPSQYRNQKINNKTI